MDTKRLSRGYGLLSAAERFALATAAAARGDELELARLGAAARAVTATVTDQFAYAVAFTDVARGHWATRLHAAALFFRLRHLADTPGPHQAMSRTAARVAAYLLRTNAAGWQQFCDRAGLDPAAGDGGFEWEDTVLQAEAEAADMGVTDTEAASLAAGDELGAEPIGPGLKTPDGVADDLHQQYHDRLAQWGVG